MTARRINSGSELKQRNGLLGLRGQAITFGNSTRLTSGAFALTVPPRGGIGSEIFCRGSEAAGEFKADEVQVPSTAERCSYPRSRATIYRLPAFLEEHLPRLDFDCRYQEI